MGNKSGYFEDIEFSGELLDKIIKGFSHDYLSDPISPASSEKLFNLNNHDTKAADYLQKLIDDGDVKGFNKKIKKIKDEHPGVLIHLDNIIIENIIVSQEGTFDLTGLDIGKLQIKKSVASVDVSGSTIRELELDKVAFPIFAYDNKTKISLRKNIDNSFQDVANITVRKASNAFGESVTIVDFKDKSTPEERNTPSKDLAGKNKFSNLETGFDLLKNKFPPCGEREVNIVKETCFGEPDSVNGEKLTKEEEKFRKRNEEADRDEEKDILAKISEKIEPLAKEGRKTNRYHGLESKKFDSSDGPRQYLIGNGCRRAHDKNTGKLKM